MATCEWCGKEYDKDEEDPLFDGWLYSYNTLVIDLCASCTNQAVEDEVGGVFSETCEGCGCNFDPMEEGGKFYSCFDPDSGAELTDAWSDSRKILCADCAIDHVDSNW